MIYHERLFHVLLLLYPVSLMFWLFHLLGDLFALVHSSPVAIVLVAVVETEREVGEYCIRSDLVVWDLAIEVIRNCGASHIPPK